MESIPVLKDSESRKQCIIHNTPAVFNIEENPTANGAAPLYEIEVASEVSKWCGSITQLALKHSLNAELAKAVIYMETTHGWYDKLYPFKKTILPMNLHYRYWRELGVTKELLSCPFYNIEFGIILLSRIKARIKDPTARKIATIYNFLGAEKVTDYGARVDKIVREKPREKKGCSA